MACGRCGQLLLKGDGYCPICRQAVERGPRGWHTHVFAIFVLAAACWLLIAMAGVGH